MCLDPLEMLRNLTKSEQKECIVVVYCSLAVNGIYLKLNKSIVPGIVKGTGLGFPYTAPFEKKNCKCILKTWNYRLFSSVSVKVVYDVGMPNTLQHQLHDRDSYLIPRLFRIKSSELAGML
jgi:hypothetical protein